MPTDDAALFELLQVIAKVAEGFKTAGSPLSSSSRIELVRNAEKLAIAAREPEENLYFQATQTAQNAAIRTAIEVEIFTKVPLCGGGVSASDLALALNMDERLLIRIMRACTSTHLFHETSPLHYVHNAFSLIFTTPANRDMFKQMYDFLGPGVYSMPRFLESSKYRNPTDYNDGAFQYGHRTHFGFWEYLKEKPERMKIFNSGMRSLATIGGATKSAGSYPFDEELGKHDLGDDDVAIVDVGGGRGQALEAIRQAFPGLKGRMVLQDVREVIEDARAQGLPSFIEPMVSSFFEPQPVKGAILYHFRRIFHDWSDDMSRAILRNTVQAMSSRSHVLITDTVVPEIGAPRHVALQDINMMSFGGMERTRLQWVDLLTEAGLSIKEFWTSDGSLQNVIEAVRKDFGTVGSE